MNNVIVFGNTRESLLINVAKFSYFMVKFLWFYEEQSIKFYGKIDIYEHA